MVNGLAGTGLLKDKGAKKQAIATTRKLLTTVQDTIARTCMPPHASLGAPSTLCTALLASVASTCMPGTLWQT